MSGQKIKVVQYGLGPIGIESAKQVLKKDGLELVGGIDIAEDKVGKDMSEILSLDTPLGMKVSSDAGTLLNQTRPQVVLHTTTSFVDKIYSQLTTIIEAGANIVSSSEELFYPSYRHPDLTKELDELAKKHGVTVLGTGVNPGFVMDLLAVCMTGVCVDVKKIEVTRIVDASKRRLPLQRKVGAGITPEEFRQRAQTGTFGHIGLVESLVAVTNSLGWKLDELKETLDPMIADRVIQTPYLTVEKGQVTGIKHIARGFVGGKEVITLDLRMYVGAEEPRDAIYVEGSPSIDLTIKGGVFGDTATVASLINAIPRVLKSTPGVKTMLDLPVPCVYLGGPIA